MVPDIGQERLLASVQSVATTSRKLLRLSPGFDTKDAEVGIAEQDEPAASVVNTANAHD